MPLAVSVQPLHHYPVRRTSHVYLPEGNYIYCGVRVRLGSSRLGITYPVPKMVVARESKLKVPTVVTGQPQHHHGRKEDVCLQLFEKSPRISFLTGFWQLQCSTFCRACEHRGPKASCRKTRRKPGSEWKPEQTRSANPFRSGHHSGPACPFHSGTWAGQARHYHLVRFFK